MKTAAEHYYDRGYRDGLAHKPAKRPSCKHYMAGYNKALSELK